VGEKNACRLLAGKPEGKRPLGRPSYMWGSWDVVIWTRVEVYSRN
jgi:hypothetical protein